MVFIFRDPFLSISLYSVRHTQPMSNAPCFAACDRLLGVLTDSERRAIPRASRNVLGNACLEPAKMGDNVESAAPIVEERR
jgi:hypothetical protein